MTLVSFFSLSNLPLEPETGSSFFFCLLNLYLMKIIGNGRQHLLSLYLSHLLICVFCLAYLRGRVDLIFQGINEKDRCIMRTCDVAFDQDLIPCSLKRFDLRKAQVTIESSFPSSRF